MSFPRLCSLSIAVLAVLAVQFSAPRTLFADAYSIVPLTSENNSLVGMDDVGHVVFELSSTKPCSAAAAHCYSVFSSASNSGVTSTFPSYDWDYSRLDDIHLSSAPYILSNNGWTATLSLDSDPNLQDLYVSQGGNAPQFVFKADGFTKLALNGVGDVVFDIANAGKWYEGINPDAIPTPEPSSLLMLATGVVGAGLLFGRRRVTV